MTLGINVYIRNAENGDMLMLGLEPNKKLFGFEVCRTELWGTKVMKDLGLTLLPTLAKTDIFAEGKKIRTLENEAYIILKNLALIADKTGYEQDFIKFRTNNILYAVQKAREAGEGGSVVIW